MSPSMRQVAALVGFLPAVLAVPAPIADPTVHAAAAIVVRVAEPTAPPRLVERDLTDDVASYFKGIESKVDSKVSAFVGSSGVLDFPNGFPTGTAVKKSLGLKDDDDLDAQPTQVLNLPSYGNWTDEGWNVRVHGNVYKIPHVDEKKIDDLANAFLIGTSVDKLKESEKEQARNLTRSIFVVQQDNVSVTMDFVEGVGIRPNASGGAFSAAGGGQKIKLPHNTTLEGDFDAFVKLKNTTGPDGGHMIPGNATSQIQTLNMYAEGKNNSGNATAYLVPPKGLTIISDIDDILRVTKIYQPKEGLLNSFARAFTPWMNMPEIYANWSSSLVDAHFHYLTTTPEQVTRNYMEFIYKTYPLGSFDTRPLNFSDVKATLSIRRFLLDKIFQTFPDRKFVLVADTSNSDVMKAYPALYKDYPGQVQCIFLRNTSATDKGDRFPYNTKGFKGIPQERYMFFHVPDDLRGLDIENGSCYNQTIKQNVTFDYQGLPFGLSNHDDGSAAGRLSPRAWTMVLGVVAALMMVVV